jgi:hypothetical protein
MLLRGRQEPDLEGNAGFMTAIDGEVQSVMAGLLELELLNVDDEVAGEKIPVGWEPDIGRQFDTGHDGTSVFIDKVHTHAVGSFFDATEDKPQGDRTLGMNSRQLMGDDGVEGAEEIEFAGIISGGVAEHCNLNIHNAFRGGRC